MITQAFVYAFDATLEQEDQLQSHVDGSTSAYKALLGPGKGNWDESPERMNGGEDVLKEDYLGTSHVDLPCLWAFIATNERRGGARMAPPPTPTPPSD